MREQKNIIRETFEYTLDTQKKIAAWLLTEQNVIEENVELVRPEYFDNPVIGDIVQLVVDFFCKYGRSLTEDELLQELDKFLKTTDPKYLAAPEDEYLDICEELLILSKEENFDYIRDLVVDFGRHQVFRKALLESTERLKKGDFDSIVNAINQAASIGRRRMAVEVSYTFRRTHSPYR